MRRCDRKCVLSVILRHLSVNIFATKYVIFYRMQIAGARIGALMQIAKSNLL